MTPPLPSPPMTACSRRMPSATLASPTAVRTTRHPARRATMSSAVRRREVRHDRAGRRARAPAAPRARASTPRQSARRARRRRPAGRRPCPARSRRRRRSTHDVAQAPRGSRASARRRAGTIRPGVVLIATTSAPSASMQPAASTSDPAPLHESSGDPQPAAARRRAARRGRRRPPGGAGRVASGRLSTRAHLRCHAPSRYSPWW